MLFTNKWINNKQFIIMKENLRKNKTNQDIIWPTTSYFTIDQIQDLNPDMKNITLRVKLVKIIEEGKISEIGAASGGKGRPQKVFSFTPVTQLTLNKAMQNNINLIDNASKLINIVDINTTNIPVTRSNPIGTTVSKVEMTY